MLNFEAVQGKSREEILAYIHQFPFEAYEICHVPEQGRFYIDIHKPDLIKFFLRAGEAWEKHTLDFIRRFARTGSTAVDIGAHIGTLTLAMAEAVGPQGQVVAFEPQPKIFRELFYNMTLNGAIAMNGSLNIQYFWSAVGNESGKVELSPSDPMNEGKTKLQGGTGQFVDIIPLDSLKLENVSLIKIDVEGMEGQVLEGARETILKNQPVILIEIGEPEAILELHRLGYWVFWLKRKDYAAFPATGISDKG